MKTLTLFEFMDTKAFDDKIAKLRQEGVKGVEFPNLSKVGRPKGPDKVVFKRNVIPELVPLLDQIAKSDSVKELQKASPEARIIIDRSHQSAVLEEELKDQIKALLEDNDRLSKELATVEHRLQRVARLTDNEKLILWIRKYDDLKKAYDLRVGGSEFSQ